MELRDWSLGIVDFPCLAAGSEVRLCWRWGEGQVAHWHEVDEGFANRKPITSLPRRPAEPAGTSRSRGIALR